MPAVLYVGCGIPAESLTSPLYIRLRNYIRGDAVVSGRQRGQQQQREPFYMKQSYSLFLAAAAEEKIRLWAQHESFLCILSA